MFCTFIMCMCNFACKGHPRNDLYCVGWDVKPYSLSHSRNRTRSLVITDSLYACSNGPLSVT